MRSMLWTLFIWVFLALVNVAVGDYWGAFVDAGFAATIYALLADRHHIARWAFSAGRYSVENPGAPDFDAWYRDAR